MLIGKHSCQRVNEVVESSKIANNSTERFAYAVRDCVVTDARIEAPSTLCTDARGRRVFIRVRRAVTALITAAMEQTLELLQQTTEDGVKLHALQSLDKPL